jgi:hypothetical protein
MNIHRLMNRAQITKQCRNGSTTRMVRWWSFTGFNSHDVAGLGLLIEMELGTASL